MKWLAAVLLLALAGCSTPAPQNAAPTVVPSTSAPVAAPTMPMVPAPTLVPPTPTPAPVATLAPSTAGQPLTKATPLATESTDSISGNTIENSTSRWLQVDAYDQNGAAIDTLNCRGGQTQSIPDGAWQLKIRVNGSSIAIKRSGMKILIDGSENLVGE